MNLHDQVCSLKFAKKLKELGVKQDSLFYWEHGHEEDCRVLYYKIRFSPDPSPGIERYSAFTVAELGAMLPDCIVNCTLEGITWCYIKSQKKGDEYKIYIDGGEKAVIFFDKKESDARAKMFIYFVEKFNKRHKKTAC